MRRGKRRAGARGDAALNGRRRSAWRAARELEKCPTGIQGLDEITFGGLPRGRPTLVCGGAGCGKTLLATEFLVRGARDFGEPGVFMSFEESSEELSQNVASLGFDLDALVARKRLSLDYVRVERSEIEETGEYDLEGLFIRLGHAIDTIGARRVVLDTVESLFSGLGNRSILRAELRRLFRWLKDRGVTAVITGERGAGTLTREGLEEYVSDCVIVLENRMVGSISTRRLRIVKYRGSVHGSNDYPFLIDRDGISIVPITALGLDSISSTERISSGIPRLDAMLGGGFFRGSGILISGTAGTGKTSLAAYLADATCRRGERALYIGFEESPSQIMRNMRSIGLNLERWVRNGRLRFSSQRPTTYGLETHLGLVHKWVNEFEPQTVLMDPISSMMRAGAREDAEALVLRLVDMLRGRGITALFTSLTLGGAAWETTELGVSSLIDTWLLLRDIELGGERNRAMYILKSRGTAHSNQIREFVITSQGVELRDVYVGPKGVLTGSARVAQEARERAAESQRQAELAQRGQELRSRRAALEAQIVGLRAELDAGALALRQVQKAERERRERGTAERAAMAASRRADSAGGHNRKER